MPFSVEAAIISKKGEGLPFNTDAVNAAGKVWPAEVIHGEKGLRVVGACNTKPYYVLASSETKGTAASAADLFQTCADKLNDDGSNYSVMIADYLKAFSKVLVESGFSSSDCAFSILAGINDTVFVAKTADSRLYTYYDDTFTEINPQMTPFADNRSDYGIAQCNHVKPGDIFILLTGAVASIFPAGLMNAICARAEGDVRKIVSMIGSQAAKYGCSDAVSAVALKVTDVLIPAAVPTAEEMQAEASAISAAFDAAVAEKSAAASAPAANELPQVNEPPVKSGKRAGMIVFICILALALLTGLFFLVKGISEGKLFPRNEPSESVTDESDSSSETESVSETETTTQKDEPSQSEEPATEETTTEKEQESTTRKENDTTNTTRRQSQPTTNNEPTTEQRTTDTPTSEEPTAEQPTSDAPTDATTETPTDATTETPVTEPTESQTETPATEPSTTETPSSDQTPQE